MTLPALVPALPVCAFQGPMFKGGRCWSPILFCQISLATEWRPLCKMNQSRIGIGGLSRSSMGSRWH
jgi:hypothetical protein